MPKRAIFGGTFDPVHRGHIGLIQQLDECLAFESVHFVLSARPPHKHRVSVSIPDRFTMLELALLEHDTYFADDTEIVRAEASYTRDTVINFSDRFPEDELFLVIGVDSLNNLPSWYRIDDWLDNVAWVVASRPGYAIDPQHPYRSRFVTDSDALMGEGRGAIWVFDKPQFEVSSTKIRNALTDGDRDAAADDLSPLVLDCIDTHELY